MTDDVLPNSVPDLTGADGNEATGAALTITPEGEVALTPDQSATIAGGLYPPTVKRIVILLQTLIDQTQAGDFALWAPLAAMEQTVGGLKFRRDQTTDARKFCALAAEALHEHANHFFQYQCALAIVTPDDPLPPFPDWSANDTLRVYDTVQRMFPTPEAPRGE